MDVEQQLRMLRGSLPITCPNYMLIAGRRRGFSNEQLLANTNLVIDSFSQKDSRIAVWQQMNIIANLLKLTKDPSISIEIGLMNRLTDIGSFGYGLMSCATLRDAVEFVVRFIPLRNPFFKLDFEVENGMAVVTVKELSSSLPFRNFYLEYLLIGVSEIFRALLTGERSDNYRYKHLHLHLDYPEPDYFGAYKDRLPQLHFNQPLNRFTFSAELLDYPIRTANSAVMQLVLSHAESELSRLGFAENWLDQVRGLLVCRNGQYPDLPSIATNLNVSERTLKRKLAEHNLNYSTLLNAVRLRDACHLLERSELSMDEIGWRLGYKDPANFTRAFRRWVGMTPSQYRKELNKEGSARGLSLTENLLEMSNRRAISEHLIDAKSQHPDSPLSIILVDIDHFKSVNDKFGHSIGDLVLRCVEDSIKNSLRDSDQVGQFGGEEFLIVLPNTTLDGARQTAERCRRLIEDELILSQENNPIRITASFGVYCSANKDEDVLNMIHHADIQLYRAKENGRNQVCVHSSEDMSIS